MTSRLARFLLALVVLATAAPALAQVTQEDIDRARREMQGIMEEAARIDARLQEARARQHQLEDELSRFEESIARTQARLTDAEREVQDVAVEMYMSAASGTGVGMVLTADQSTIQAALEYLRTVNGSGRALINELTILSTELEQLVARKGEASEEQAKLAVELEQMSAELMDKLGKAQVHYDKLVAEKKRQDEEERRRREEEERREEEARRLAAATSTTRPQTTTTTTRPQTTTTRAGGGGGGNSGGGSGPTDFPPGGVCPVAGPVTFSNTWRAPRDGGARSHEGVDMIAPRGTPIVAIYDGWIHRLSTGSRQGLGVWLRAENGDHFFYAHLDSYGDISVGQRVEAGYVIGYNGTTGNAPPELPHLHFEWHPGGGAAVNPYFLVRSLC